MELLVNVRACFVREDRLAAKFLESLVYLMAAFFAVHFVMRMAQRGVSDNLDGKSHGTYTYRTFVFDKKRTTCRSLASF